MALAAPAGPPLAVLLATILTKVLNLQDKGVAVVGQLPAGLPVPGLPPLGGYAALLLPAAGVLLVGYTDNVLTGRAFAIRGGYSTNAWRRRSQPCRELLQWMSRVMPMYWHAAAAQT